MESWEEKWYIKVDVASLTAKNPAIMLINCPLSQNSMTHVARMFWLFSWFRSCLSTSSRVAYSLHLVTIKYDHKISYIAERFINFNYSVAFIL